MTAPASRTSYYFQRLEAPDAVLRANVYRRVCGTVIYLRPKNRPIARAGFQPSGCGCLVACCSALLEQFSRPMVDHRRVLPDATRYCAELAMPALQTTPAKLSAPAPRQEEAV